MSRKAKKVKNERVLYEYFDGEKDRIADPCKLYERLYSHPDHDFFMLVEDGMNPLLTPEDRVEAATNLIGIARSAFGVKDLQEDVEDPMGLTDHEVMLLIEDFHSWVEEFKKKAYLKPTRWQLSDVQIAAESTSDSSGFSTENESSASEQRSSGLES